ncbi:MAG: molybdopterin-guanine dinucleotide biosynthesis protein A [Alphaproteobacteria bacterium]
MAAPAQPGAPPAEAAKEPSDDRGANYYYPPPQSREFYRSPASVLVDSTRERRIAFVTGMTQQMLSEHYPLTFAMFAKGDDANRLIIVSLSDGGYNTLYRARALFAVLTAIARLTPYFRENAVDALYNFFDLCKLLGFQQITWSDGKQLAHQIVIK